MSLKFVIGSSGSGKTEYLYNRVIQASMAQPERTFFYIVPEQFTMQTQRDLVLRHPHGGLLNIEVQSFQRLAYRVFDEVGVPAVPVLNDTGKMMILRKVYENCREQLKTLHLSPKRLGALDEVKSLLSEFLLYDVDIEKLKTLAEQKSLMSLSYKLQDMQILSEHFFAYLKEHYITSEQILQRLTGFVKHSALLRDSVVVLDGFTGFTPLQYNLIRELMNCSAKVVLAVTMDTGNGAAGIGQTDEADLFYLCVKTMRQMRKLALEQRVEVEEPVCLDTGNPRLEGEPALLHLERNLFRRTQQVYRKPQQAIQIAELPKPSAEALYVARTICRLIRDEGIRCGQIAVVSGAIENYEEVLKRTFADYGIPCFYDNKPPLLLNPMLEWVRAVLNMVAERFSYESVFRYFRCGLSGLSYGQIDNLENYVLECGLHGFADYEAVWVYRGERTPEELAELNQYRAQFVEDLRPILEVWKKKKATVREKTLTLYRFMEKKQLYEQLKEREACELARQDAVKAKEYAQVYGMVLEILDQYVELLGEEQISIQEYMQILDAGFADAAVGILPPGNDYVLLGDLERTRLNEIKVLFLVGVNDGIVPKIDAGGGILSQQEREQLADAGAVLAPLAQETFSIQRYYLYLLLTKPKERLYLTYSAAGVNHEALRPSFLIGQILRQYHGLKVQRPAAEPESLSELLTWRELYRFLQNGISGDWMQKTGNVSGSADGLSGNMQELPEDVQEEFERRCEEWRLARLAALEQDSLREAVRRMEQAASYENRERRLPAQTAQRLFGDVLAGSATRLERFSACPFSHFIRYGLELKPRKRLAFTAADQGTVFHEALEQYMRYCIRENADPENLADEQKQALLRQFLEEGIARAKAESLYRTARGTYHRERMLRLLSRSTWVISEQLKRGDFKLANYELDFSAEQGILPLPLSDERLLVINGRIDRMDILESGDRRFLRIIDYKSGSRQFSVAEWAAGLQLQLMLYLKAALLLQKKQHPEQEIIPAGVFLQHLEDPVLKLIPDEQFEAHQERLLGELKLDGYVNGDYQLVSHMDRDFSGASRIIPVCLNKDGSYSKAGTKLLSTKQFEWMLRKNDELLQKIGEEILDGKTEIAPYQMKGTSPCPYCEYHGICGFDKRIPCYEYRSIKTEHTADILKHLEEEYGSEVDDTATAGH